MQVMSADLKEHGYYKKKGQVVKLINKYVGEIEMLDSGDVLQVCMPSRCFDHLQLILKDVLNSILP